MSTWYHKLVLVHSDTRLFGKVVGEHTDAFDIEFFNSVAERETKRVLRRDVSHAALPTQTRVFIQAATGLWRVGRIVDLYRVASGSFSYSLKFPNAELEEYLEDACYVRCLDRRADPSKILAAGCIETQFFADKRRSAMRSIRNLRSSAQGLTGVISAPVELVSHQIATIRRVLNDLHLRYLLADEVGLGKTIEAGLIIRQLLLDDPSLTVQIVAPKLLVDQWQYELATKCLLTDEVSVISHDELFDIDVSSAPDLLVIDEAHRLIDPEPTSPGFPRYGQLRRLAVATARVLLLSATPALGDEPRLLALLNLLDPITYPLNELPQFRRRVEDRQAIGRFLLTLQPSAAKFVLRQQADRALEVFPDDQVVKAGAERLRQSLDDPPQRDAAVRALRYHIAETYRIHQRLIRTRRADVAQWLVRPRGPEWPVMTHVRFFFSQDAHAEAVLLALESWRDGALRQAHQDDSLTDLLADRWWYLVGANWQGAEALIDAVLHLSSLFAEESDALVEIERVARIRAEAQDRYSLAAQTIRDWSRQIGTDNNGRPKKIVCFSSATADAKALVVHLEKVLGEASVASLVGMGGHIATAVAEFSTSRSGLVLVCDSESEEGLNLQFAFGIVHMNLPLSVTGLEQRIGRLDRFGRRLDRVDHRLFLPDDLESSPCRSWFQILANGFRAFNRSVSDVQFCLERMEAQARRSLFLEGTYAIDGLLEEIGKGLAAERSRLDEQHALDGLSELVEGGDELVQRIEDAEQDEEKLAETVEPWITKVLGLSIDSHGTNRAGAWRIEWARDVLLPAIPWKRVFESALRPTWTWRRRIAASSSPRSPALLRPGCVLFEALERVALWDDRGIAYATWRVDPDSIGGWRGFRLVWTIEPDFASQVPVYARRENAALERRAEAMLPQMTVEQWFDDAGRLVEDSTLLGILDRPYNPERRPQGAFDINLGSRPDTLREVMEISHLVTLVHDVTSKARKKLLDIPAVLGAIDEARLKSERESLAVQRDTEVRTALAAKYPGLVQPPHALEETASETIRRAIGSPRISLDEIGFMIVTPEPPRNERYERT